VLSVRVTGAADGEYVCALSLEPLAKVRANDAVQHERDLAIVVADDSVSKLRGATVRLERGPAAQRLRGPQPETSRLPLPSPFPPSR